RLLRLLSALACAIRGSYIVCVFVVFLHSEIENKATSTHAQEIFGDFGHTKVTVGSSRWHLRTTFRTSACTLRCATLPPLLSFAARCARRSRAAKLWPPPPRGAGATGS